MIACGCGGFLQEADNGWLTRRKRRLWELHQTARAYAQRPSGLIGLHGGRLALEFDVAVLREMRQVEVKLEKRDRKGRALYSLEQLLDETPTAGGFKPLGHRARRRTG